MQHFKKPRALNFNNLKPVLDGGCGRIRVREDDAEVGELWDNGKMQVLLTLLRDPKEAALLRGGRVRLPPFVRQTTFLGNEKLCFAALRSTSVGPQTEACCTHHHRSCQAPASHSSEFRSHVSGSQSGLASQAGCRGSTAFLLRAGQKLLTKTLQSQDPMVHQSRILQWLTHITEARLALDSHVVHMIPPCAEPCPDASALDGDVRESLSIASLPPP